MDEESSDLAEPLLEEDRHEQRKSHSTYNAVFNLSKVIIGAGMMAIPRAYFQVGSIIGTAMLIGVGALTYYTLAALVRGSSVTGATTYSQLALVTCGRTVMKTLQLAVLAFCFGFGVVYLVIIRDILLGTGSECDGLLCELLGIKPSSLLANPQLVITAVAVIVIAPLLLLRSMEKLAVLNAVGVTSIALLAAVSAGLALKGLAAGTAHPIPTLPQWGLLGPTRREQLEALTSIVPVLIACYVAHQSLHPLMPLVKPYSDDKMRRVIGLALLISFGVYVTLAAGAALAFGPDVQVNVLNNFSVAGLEPLVGAAPARLVSWSIRGGYLISLLASLLLYMHPLRACLAEMIWQQDMPDHQTLKGHSRIINSSDEASLPAAAQAAAGAAGKTSAAADDVENSSSSSSTNGAFAAAAPTGAAAGPVHFDPNPLDDSRVLVAFDSMDQPAFGSWKPGFKFFGLGSKRDSLNPSHLVNPTGAATTGRTQANRPSTSSSVGAAAVAASDAEVEGAFCPQQQQQQSQHSWQQQEQQWYYLLTYGLLTSMVLVAVLASNIWVVLSAIGDLSSTLQAFVVPGLIAVVLAVRSKATGLRLPQQQQQQQHRSSTAASPGGRPVPAATSGSAVSAHASSTRQANSRQYSCRCLLQLQCGDGVVPVLLQRVMHTIMGAFVVALGLALFANGIFQRVYP